MTHRLLFLLTAVATISADVGAQSREEMLRRYPWVDTTGESGVYPIGDAVDVYRAALDLLYKDGDKHPSVIVVHDTIEIGGDKPCPVKCDYVWHHKSKMDTTTILAFARQSPKRPRFRKFDYSIPIVLLSYDGRQLLEHDGIGYLAARNLPNDMPGRATRVAFSLKYPGAWGLAQFGKVGFNTAHTEALVQVRHSCLEACGSDEALFLKRVNGRWTVIERIPTYAETSLGYGSLRYRGPAGSSPSESEIVADPSGRSVARSESKDAEAVYRSVLDSLYSFQGDSPSMVVLTDRFRTAGDTLRTPRTKIDAELLQKYAFLEAARATPDRAFRYRVPVRIVLGDSTSALEKIGAPIALQTGMQASLWFGFNKQFPGAWGMVGFTRVAFNLPHTQAMVYSNHQCGPYCDHGDTWVLARRGESWRVVERISRNNFGYNSWEPMLFPLRYVGLDAKPNAYRHRHMYAQLTNAVTNQPLPHVAVRTALTRQSRIATTDAAGRIDLGTMPFAGYVELEVGCPDQSRPDSLNVDIIGIDPGSDTTVVRPVDFRRCFRTSGPLGITGGQAFIGPTEARFVFPFRPDTATWNLPLRRTSPGVTGYLWEVEWNWSNAKDGEAVSLWLEASQKGKPDSVKSLAELIRGGTLEPMLICQSCSETVMFEDPKKDRQHIFANVVDGRVVFTLRGDEAIKRVFPVAPRTITLRTVVTHTPTATHKEWQRQESQRVLVNCRSSDSTGSSRRRCNAPTNARFAAPSIDSTSPRRVRVVALSYDGASLMRNLDVRIRSEDLKDPIVTRSTGLTGDFSILQSPRDSVAIEALCPVTSANQRAVSGQLALYIAAGRDTTLQLLVDPRRCR